MKDFQPIKSNGERRAICAALNKLIWKLPAGEHKTIDAFAGFILRELADRDITIKWDAKNERFHI